MTPAQKKALDFIKLFMEIKGYAPSYQNIADGLNYKSKSNAHRLVQILKNKGLLHLEPKKIRSLKVYDKSINEPIDQR